MSCNRLVENFLDLMCHHAHFHDTINPPCYENAMFSHDTLLFVESVLAYNR